MRRLLQAPDGGLPYVNSDLTDILQAQHLRSYRAMLDGINYGSTSSTEPLNSGIILSGCEIVSSNGSQFVMSFSNSVVYIDGEFYQNDPSYQSSNQTISNGTFYLKPGTTASETRVLRDLTTSATVSNARYFEHTQTPPTGPHIKFSSQGTSRYLKRVIKYFTSVRGDIYVTKSKINFDSNGVGFNDMEGFVVLDSSTGIPSAPNLSAKFLVGYDNTFGSIGSGAGHTSSIILKSQLPSHTHISNAPSGYNFQHDHFINRGAYKKGSGDEPESTIGDPDLPITDTNMGSVFGAADGSIKEDREIRYTGGVHDYSNSKISTHKHSISTEFGNGTIGDPGLEHENRPPYYVVVYYTKKLN